MPSTDFSALKEAVKATLAAVPSVGKIETRVGGIPTWVERLGPRKAFWEIGVASVAETAYAATVSIYEDSVVQIEGVMPFSYDDNTEAAWDALLVSMRDALRENPSLKANDVPTVTGGWRGQGFGLPQLTVNNLVTFEDGGKGARCHHAVIEVRYRNDFDFTVQG